MYLSSILIPIGWLILGHLIGRLLAIILRAFIARVDPVKLSLWLLFPGLLIGRIAETASKQFNNDYIFYIGLCVFGVLSVLPLQLFLGIVLAMSKNSEGRELSLFGKRIERIEDEEND